MKSETFIPFEADKKVNLPVEYIVALNHEQKRGEHYRAELARLKSKMSSILEQIEDTVKVEHTKWSVMLKRDGDKWISLGCVDTNNPPDDMRLDWDVLMPIPEPSTIKDFKGF